LADWAGTGEMRVAERQVKGAYGFALMLVLFSILASIALGWKSSGLVLVGLLQGLTLIVALRVSGARKRIVVGSFIAAGFAIAAAAALMIGDFTTHHGLVPALWSLIVMAAIASIARRVSEYDSVNIQTVLGLLTIYLLLGVFFSYAAQLVNAYVPFFAGGQTDAASFTYFSFVTLSTTGYGDLVAAEGIPRSVAVAEALVGQLYLVSVVSVAVSRISRPQS
jgi:hypothetical protein